MAKRPVFVTKEKIPFYETLDVEFIWNRGLAKSQKQKNVKAIHEEFFRQMPEKKVLEISSKSMQEGGTRLSAFSLKKFVPELGKSLPVECVYQAGKVFEHGGPYTDLLHVTPHDAKTDERLKNSGPMIYGVFDGKNFPLAIVEGLCDRPYTHHPGLSDLLPFSCLSACCKRSIRIKKAHPAIHLREFTKCAM